MSTIELNIEGNTIAISQSRKRRKKLLGWLKATQANAPIPAPDETVRRILFDIARGLEENLALPEGWRELAQVYDHAGRQAARVAIEKDGTRRFPAFAVSANYVFRRRDRREGVLGTVSDVVAEVPRYLDFMRLLLKVKPPKDAETIRSIEQSLEDCEDDYKSDDFRARVEKEVIFVLGELKRRQGASI